MIEFQLVSMDTHGVLKYQQHRYYKVFRRSSDTHGGCLCLYSPLWGASGRRFKSSRPDQLTQS